MVRCNWKNLEKSKIYQEYHDHEWGVPSYDERYLFEMLILESFHCGLSWLIVLRKREAFKKAFDDFDVKKVAAYTEEKVEELMLNQQIIRNRRKILAAIQNAKSYINVQKECGTFSNYIWSFTQNEVVRIPHDGTITKNELSDRVSRDMKKRGFQFMGTVTTFSYLEAIGVMNNHAEYCFYY